MLGLAVVLIFELAEPISVYRVLVAKPRGPRRKCVNRISVLKYRRLNFYDVALVKLQRLFNYKAAVGILERQNGGGGFISGFRGKVQRRIEFVANGFVVGIQRERVSVFRGCCLIHKVERMTLVVLILLENPRLGLCAAVAECDPVEIILNYSFGFGLRFFGSCRLRRGCVLFGPGLYRLLLCSGGRRRRGTWGWRRLGGLVGPSRALLLWPVFLHVPLRAENSDCHEQEHQQEFLLHAGLGLWTLVLWHWLVVANGGVSRVVRRGSWVVRSEGRDRIETT